MWNFARWVSVGVAVVCFCVSCASQAGVSSEELYAIGMAYYDQGKFADAEKWLSRASAMDKTQTASEYQLGRIAYETGKYTEAKKYFQRILRKDPTNLMAMKSTAYCSAKLG
jgi:tetratricopeptide (TPR) repeat protein